MRKTLIAAALLLGSAAASAGPVAVLVAIPIPAQLDRPKLESLMGQTVPRYQKLPGLIRKYFTIGDDNRAGGMYLFASRAAAEAWFNDAWKAGVAKQWGAPASVSYFDVPFVVDGENANATLPPAK